ncbi:MAG: hypothetical protein KF699_03510 [Phycisphaeraceae bacterium]|nr:hypothetical protein [Phycisphaeraceae bacterium]
MATSRRTPGSTIFAAVAGVAVCGAAAAGPVNKNWIAANATWYVHVDAEAAVNSTLGQYVVTNRSRLGLDGMDGLRALGIDPFKDIKSVTIYDTDDDPENAVVVASTTSAVEQLMDMLRADPATRTMTVDGHSLIAFDDKGKTQYWHARSGEAPDARVVFMSDDWRTVTDAVKVASGDRSSLARVGAGSPLAGDPNSGSILFIRAAELPRNIRDNPDPNASALLGQVGGVQLDVGERGGEVYGDAQFHTASAEDAQNMSQVAQGLLALGRMITKNNADLAPVSGVLAAIRVEPQDRQLKVGIRFAAKQVVEAIDSTIRAREKANAAGASKENAP